MQTLHHTHEEVIYMHQQVIEEGQRGSQNQKQKSNTEEGEDKDLHAITAEACTGLFFNPVCFLSLFSLWSSSSQYPFLCTVTLSHFSTPVCLLCVFLLTNLHTPLLPPSLPYMCHANGSRQQQQ